MPTTPRKLPTDVNQRAKKIVDLVTGGEEPEACRDADAAARRNEEGSTPKTTITGKSPATGPRR